MGFQEGVRGGGEEGCVVFVDGADCECESVNG